MPSNTTSYVVVAVLGIAKPGPIVRYKRVVKKYANLLPAALDKSNKDSLSLAAVATTARIGRLTADNKNPIVTGVIFDPDL